MLKVLWPESEQKTEEKKKVRFFLFDSGLRKVERNTRTHAHSKAYAMTWEIYDGIVYCLIKEIIIYNFSLVKLHSFGQVIDLLNWINF